MSSETIIIGAGIIGVSTAYYLSQHQDPTTIHIVETSPELFSSASGFSGGFLAKDWFYPRVADLGAFSFEEHRRLAEQHNGKEKWGYSPTICLSYYASEEARKGQKRGDDWLRDGTSRADAAPVILDSKSNKTPTWLWRNKGDQIELISAEGTTAQVDPLRLCHFLLKESMKRGVKLHQPAKAVSVKTEKGVLAGVRIVNVETDVWTELPCKRLIIAAGCWTGEVFRALFPKSNVEIPIKSLAGHSLVLKSPRWHAGVESNGCHAVFTSHKNLFCPEIFSRLGGHIYFAGLNSSTLPLQDPAKGKATPYKENIDQLREAATAILGRGEKIENDMVVVREGLCFRPVTSRGTPIISRIRDRYLGPEVATSPGSEGGVFVASGHGPWGISMSLGTGVVLAELAQGRRLSADISGLAFEVDQAEL